MFGYRQYYGDTYIHQLDLETKKYVEHKRGVGNRLWLSIPLDGGRNDIKI